MAEVGSANIKITADDSEARSTISGFTGFLRKTAGVAAGVMAGFAAFEGIRSTFAGLSEATIGANANMEMYEATLTTVLKSHDKAIETLKWAETFAATTPFEIPEIIDATAKLSAYGLTAQDVLKDIGDMAAIMGKPLDQAIEAFADAQTGELERLKEFGITKKMLAEEAQEVYHQELVNSKGQITDQELLNKALLSIMRERYSGGMEIASQTFKGMVSNARDAMGTIMRELSRPVFDRFKQGLQDILPAMSATTAYIKGDMKNAADILIEAYGQDRADQILRFFRSFGDGIRAALDWFAQFKPAVQSLMDIAIGLSPIFAAVGGAIAVAFQQIAAVIPPIINQITEIAEIIVEWEAFIPIVGGLAAAFASFRLAVMATTAITALHGAITLMMNPMARALLLTQLWTKAQAFLNATLLANPIGLIIGVVAGLAAGLYIAYQRSETFRNAINNLAAEAKGDFNELIDITRNFGNRIRDEFKQDYDELVSYFQQAKGRMQESIQRDIEFFDRTKTTIQTKLNEWGPVIENFFDTLPARTQAKLSAWGTSIKGWLEAQHEENKRQFSAWGESISQWFDSQPSKIRTKLSGWWSAIYEWFSSLPSRTQERLSNWWASISSWVSDRYSSWKESLSDWWRGIYDWFSSLPSRTAERLSNWWNSINTWVRNRYSSWKQSLESWWKAQFEWWSGLPSRTGERLSNWWSSIASWMKNSAKNWRTSFENWWREIKAWFSSLPEKVEIRNSGRKMVDKVAQGNQDQKKTFMDKLGKIAVDAIVYMLGAIAIIAVAAGREIIKRIINGINQQIPQWLQKWEEMKADARRKLGEMAVQAYNEAAKIPGKIGKAISDKMRDAGDAMKGLANNLITRFKEALGINSPSRVFYDLTGSIFEGIKKRLSTEDLKKVGLGIFNDFAGGAGAAFSSIKGFISGAGGNLSSWITSALAITGTPMSWLPYLQTIAMKESGGNPRAYNNWDINAKRGIASRGLMQTIPPTFNAYKLKGFSDIYNPIHNTIAAIRYIKDRYGNVLNVPGIKSMLRGGAYRGYMYGGIIDSPQFAALAEDGKPEAVVPLVGRRMDPFAIAVAGKLAEIFDSVASAKNGAEGLRIEVPVYLDRREIARVVAPDINEELERIKRRDNRAKGVI